MDDPTKLKNVSREVIITLKGIIECEFNEFKTEEEILTIFKEDIQEDIHKMGFDFSVESINFE